MGLCPRDSLPVGPKQSEVNVKGSLLERCPRTNVLKNIFCPEHCMGSSHFGISIENRLQPSNTLGFLHGSVPTNALMSLSNHASSRPTTSTRYPPFTEPVDGRSAVSTGLAWATSACVSISISTSDAVVNVSAAAIDMTAAVVVILPTLAVATKGLAVWECGYCPLPATVRTTSASILHHRLRRIVAAGRVA